MAPPKRRANRAPLILQNNERYYPLRVLAKLLPERPHKNSLVNWCRDGARSEDGQVVTMEFVWGIGMRRRCRQSSLEAYQRFIEAINGYKR
jgi:hypothetical protein